MPRFVGRNVGEGGDAVIPDATTTSKGVIQVGSGLSVNSGILSADASGTVTSVGMTVPTFLSVTGSPITGSGTLAVTAVNQDANKIFAGPVTGAAASPAFRSLVEADIPALPASKITSGTLSASLLPVATSTTLGAIKVGTGLVITNGILEADLPVNSYISSLSMEVPTSVFTIDGSPVVSAPGGGSGLLSLTLNSQTANTVFAAPNGSNGTPTFRALAATDIPNLAATKITIGQLPLARGGTGADLSATGGAKQYVKQTTAGGVFTVGTIPVSDISGVALTKTDDTNVTLTLGGTPASALLAATSLTLGWTGQLAPSRGGTGLSSVGTANQILGVQDPNSGGLEYKTLTAGSGISITHGAGSITITSTGAGSGTVTSVGLTVPTGLSVTPASITTSGTFDVTLAAGYSIPTTASQTNWDTAYTDRMKWDGGSTGLTAATGRTSLGATTVGSNLFTLTNPGAVAFLRLNADNTVSALNALDFRSAIGAGTGSGNGTVTSVGMTVPTGLTVTPASITSSGTFAVSFDSGYSLPLTASQTNWDTAYTDRLKWDGGATGLVASTGRTSLGATDVGSNLFTLANPSAVRFLRINANNTVDALSAADFRTAIGAGSGSGTVTDVTASAPLASSGGTTPNITLGTVGVANGGTGLTATPTNGQLLIGNGTGFSLATLTAGSNITITNTAGGIEIASTGGGGGGGMTNPMTTLGDIIYGAASGAATRLPGETGATRKFLRSVGSSGSATAPVWDTLTAADIPALSYLPISGGTLSGSINLGGYDITNTGLINFKGSRSYTSSGGGAATSGYYAPVVITSITTQYARLSLTLAISTEGGSGDASEIETAIVQLRFKQQNPMASSSIVDLEVLSSTSDSWTTDSFIFIQTSNTAGLSEGRLYVEIKHNYSNVTATVLNYFTSAGASYTVCSASTSPTNALVAPASLPAGTQTKPGSFYTSGSDTLRMYAGSAERVRVSSAGRVGVGTTTPQTRLHVDLTGAVLDADLYNNTDAILAVQNGGTGVRLVSSTSDPTNIANVPAIVGVTSRGSVDAITAVSSGDYLGRALFQGIASAGGRASSSELRAAVDAAPGSNFVPGRLEFWTSNTSGTLAERMRLDNSGNLVLGTASLATTATNGFLYIASCGGTPTGVPSTYAGRNPMVFDTSTSSFYIYNSGWQKINGSGGAAGGSGNAVTYTTYQMNLTSSTVAARIDDVNYPSSRIYTVENIGYYGVYLGSDSNVSTSTGFKLEPGDIFETVLTAGGAIWGVTEFGTVRLAVIRGE